MPPWSSSSGERWPAGVTPSAGVTSSQLFTGPVGSARRREYTAMGDGINLAARLMQRAAAGQVLCEAGCARARPGPQGQEPRPHHGEGQTGARGDGRASGRSRGREGAGAASWWSARPCARSRRALAEGRAGGPCSSRAQLAWARRPSRLAGDRASESGFAVHRLGLGPFSQERAFAAWRGPLRSLLGVRRGDTPEALREARDADLRRGARRLPRPAQPAPRPARGAERGRPEPLGQRAEGPHLRHARPRLPPREPAPHPLRQPPPRGPGLPGAARVPPERRGGRTLAFCGRLTARAGAYEPQGLNRGGGGGPPEPCGRRGASAKDPRVLRGPASEVLDWFMDRSRGNPTLVGALLAAVESAGLLVRDAYGVRVDQDRLFKTAFPDTLEGLYLARVDRLPVGAREILQYASILGVSVSVNLLREMCGRSPEALQEGLERPAGGGAPRARHLGRAGVRPLRRGPPARRRLPRPALRLQTGKGHLGLARILDVDAERKSRALARPSPTTTSRAERRRGASSSTAWRAATPSARYDNVTALKHLEYVCRTLTPDTEDVEDAFSLMEVYGFIGQGEKSESIVRTLEEMVTQLSLSQQARLCYYLARLRWQAQDWKETEALLVRGLEFYRQADDVVGMGKTYVNLVGLVYGPTGRMDEAAKVLGEALALRRGPGQTGFRTLARMNLGAVLRHQGRLEEAGKWYRGALQSAIRGGLGPQRGMIACNLGVLCNDLGDFSGAISACTRAEAILGTFAIRGVLLNAKEIRAEAYLALGRASEGRILLEELGRQAGVLGHRQVAALTEQGLAKSALLEGRAGEFLERSDHALGALGANANPTDFALTLYGLLVFLRSLGARKRASKSGSRFGLAELVGGGELKEDLKASLARLAAWIEGEEGGFASNVDTGSSLKVITAGGGPRSQFGTRSIRGKAGQAWKGRGCDRGCGAGLPG